jgi:hypothetical protein
MKDKLAIIVPYRDRQDHLDVFVPHMHEFLKDKGIDYTIFIAEQSDNRPFNYGKLCNVVTKEVGKEYTYFAFHDIDMLPMNDECDYGYPDSPTHLSTHVEAHNNNLPYPQYFGGVIVISREDFENANGYSNEYWGYGFEDLDLLYRLERSGAYLEKFYDSNKTYSKYNIDDVLPYRIENVDLITKRKKHDDSICEFGKDTKIYGPINKFTKETIDGDFFISFWFNDIDDSEKVKNLFCFEGCDSGVFLSGGRYIISQIWDCDENHYQTNQSYYKKQWNHVVFSKKGNELSLYLNNEKKSASLPDNFKMYDYFEHCIKISDDDSTISISSIKLFKGEVDDKIVSDLYFKGNKVVQLITNQYGLELSNHYKFDKLYNRLTILDSGSNLNHLKLYGSIRLESKTLDVYDEIYIPIRTDGIYKSLKHSNDSDIINNYYLHDPDIEENSDIFFHDVIPNKLDYKSIGLSTIKYKILNKENKKKYELIKIVT